MKEWTQAHVWSNFPSTHNEDTGWISKEWFEGFKKPKHEVMSYHHKASSSTIIICSSSSSVWWCDSLHGFINTQQFKQIEPHNFVLKKTSHTSLWNLVHSFIHSHFLLKRNTVALAAKTSPIPLPQTCQKNSLTHLHASIQPTRNRPEERKKKRIERGAERQDA